MEILNKSTFKTKVFDFENNKDWNFSGIRPAIVDFYADWCAPCRALNPVLKEISEDYAGQIDVYKVNTEVDPELAALFDVRGIPAVLFIPASGMPTMSSGFMPKESFQRAIEQVFGIKK